MVTVIELIKIQNVANSVMFLYVKHTQIV